MSSDPTNAIISARRNLSRMTRGAAGGLSETPSPTQPVKSFQDIIVPKTLIGEAQAWAFYASDSDASAPYINQGPPLTVASGVQDTWEVYWDVFVLEDGPGGIDFSRPYLAATSANVDLTIDSGAPAAVEFFGRGREMQAPTALPWIPGGSLSFDIGGAAWTQQFNPVTFGDGVSFVASQAVGSALGSALTLDGGSMFLWLWQP